MENAKRTIIVGAGIAGLTLAYLLSRDGHDVVLVEKESRVGGLARSFTYDGFVFDIGPHRFHTDLPHVNNFIHEVLADDYLMVKRKSGVHMFGRYFDWPLGFRSLFKMPLPLLLRIALDLFRKKNCSSENFEDYIKSKYGKTLYEIFFRPYTEKFLHLPCSGISRDWAVTGIDRAVIDKKAQFSDLSSLLKTLLKTEPPIRFIYPKSGGIHVFCDILRDRIIENGGTILMRAQIEGIVRTGDAVTGVTIGGEDHRCDELVWTGPVNGLLTLLDEPHADLRYLSLIIFNYRLDAEARMAYQWCYFGAADMPYNRVSIPVLFNPSLAPPGKSGICVEVTCMEGDDCWKSPQKLESVIREKLCSTGVIGDADDIIGYDIERVENAYPVYTTDYKSILHEVLLRTGGLRNLKLLGRTGAFWYNNMDHSIEAALNFHKELTAVAN